MIGEMRQQREETDALPLRRRGIASGDRVAVLLMQGAAVPVAHAAIYKLGAVALPVGWAFALALVAGVFTIGHRLQRDTEGLV